MPLGYDDDENDEDTVLLELFFFRIQCHSIRLGHQKSPKPPKKTDNLYLIRCIEISI